MMHKPVQFGFLFHVMPLEAIYDYNRIPRTLSVNPKPQTHQKKKQTNPKPLTLNPKPLNLSIHIIICSVISSESQQFRIDCWTAYCSRSDLLRAARGSERVGVPFERVYTGKGGNLGLRFRD